MLLVARSHIAAATRPNFTKTIRVALPWSSSRSSVRRLCTQRESKGGSDDPGAESGVHDCRADNLPLSFPAVETADRVSREGIAVGHVRRCVCFNFQLYHFTVSLCDAVVVCQSVCSNKPVSCRNNWTSRAGIWRGCFLPPIPHCDYALYKSSTIVIDIDIADVGLSLYVMLTDVCRIVDAPCGLGGVVK